MNTGLQWPSTPPGNSATIDLFNSVTIFGSGMLRTLDVSMLTVNFMLLDQAVTLKAYYSKDRGTTWTQITLPGSTGTASIPIAGLSVSAVSAGADSVYDLVIDRYVDFKLTATAGATGPTAVTGWDGVMNVIHGALAIQK